MDEDEWEKVQAGECCTPEEALKLARRSRRDDLVHRWRQVVKIFSTGSDRRRAVIEGTEQLIQSVADNDKLVEGWKKGKESGKRALEKIQEKNDEDDDESVTSMVRSIQRSEEAKETVGILGDFRQEESYITLLAEGRKIFDNPAVLDDEQSLSKAVLILKGLEESETFSRLKAHTKDVLVKYCDKETVERGKQVYEEVKGSRELKQMVSGGKRIVANVAKGQEEDLGAAIGEMVELGGQLVKQVKQSDAGAVLLEKGKETVDKLAKAIDSDEVSDLLKENKEFLEELKKVVVVWVREQLLSVQIPAMSGLKETKVGKVDYELKSMKLHDLDIPNDAVHFLWEMNILTVRIEGVKMSMKDFEWKYQKLAFPRLKDEGKANAEVQGGTCVAVFQISTRVNILDLSMKFESFRLKTHGTKASWLYNLVFTLFRAKILKSLHENVNAALERHALSLSDVINRVIQKHLPKLAAKLVILNKSKDDNEEEDDEDKEKEKRSDSDSDSDSDD